MCDVLQNRPINSYLFRSKNNITLSSMGCNNINDWKKKVICFGKSYFLIPTHESIMKRVTEHNPTCPKLGCQHCEWHFRTFKTIHNSWKNMDKWFMTCHNCHITVQYRSSDVCIVCDALFFLLVGHATTSGWVTYLLLSSYHKIWKQNNNATIGINLQAYASCKLCPMAITRIRWRKDKKMVYNY